MSVRLAIAALILLLTLPGTRTMAQADEEHARAVARATCQNGKQSQTVTQASSALERDPEDLGLRMRLADALVDQGCYQEAVGVLEAGEEAHARSKELAAKLRDVRSLVTEQTYIEGLTQAAETAKFQRNQLRCTRLADLTACEDALKIKPEDQQLLAAREEAMKAKLAAARAVGAAQAAAVTQSQAAMQGLTAAQGPAASRAHATTQTADAARARAAIQAEATQAQHTSPNLQASAAPRRARSPGSATRVGADSTAGPEQAKRLPSRPAAPGVETPAAAIASLGPPPRVYSNEAPPGQTN